MGTFAAGIVLNRHTLRPVAGVTLQVRDFTTAALLTPDGGQVTTGAVSGGYDRFVVPDVDSVTLVAPDGTLVDLVSVEAQEAAAAAGPFLAEAETRLTELESGSGTSGSGETIQVGGTQPASGWWLDNGAVAPDGTAPTTPTGLTATATGGSTVNLNWTASTDNIGVTGYNYRIGTGAAVNAGAGTTETVTGLSPLTAYSFQVQAYDAQGNVSGWSTAANATTLDGPDTTPPTAGTLAASAITQSTFTLTVTGASDNIGLHATPYAFSTDNGTTWSAWQAAATYNVTGRSPSTGYQARHKVRDAAGNEATGTAITVTTSAPTPLVADDFNRADTTAAVGLGTTSVGSKTWADGQSGGNWRILSNKARSTVNAPTGGAHAYLTGVTPTPDMRVTAKMAAQAGNNGSVSAALLTRYVGNTFYRFQLAGESTNSYISINAVVDGTTQPPLAGATHSRYNFPGVLAAWEEVAVEVTCKEEAGGTRVILKVGGVERVNVLHAAATRPQGTGLALANSNGAQFDDLAIYPA